MIAGWRSSVSLLPMPYYVCDHCEEVIPENQLRTHLTLCMPEATDLSDEELKEYFEPYLPEPLTKLLECQNCGALYDEKRDHAYIPLAEMQDLLNRISPGELVPYGECRKCGAVLHASTITPEELR